MTTPNHEADMEARGPQPGLPGRPGPSDGHGWTIKLLAPAPGRAPATGAWRHTWPDELALVLVTVIWGSTFVVVSRLVAQASPSQVLVTRFALAAALLVALSARQWRHRSPALARGGLTLGAWLAAGFGLQTVGLAYTTPARSAFITGFCVVLPPFIGAVVERRPIPRSALLAALLAGAGVGLIGWPGTDQNLNVGDLLTAGCAVAYGAHIYATGRYASSVRPDLLTAAQVLVAAVLFTLGSAAAAAAIALSPPDQAPAWAVAVAGRAWTWTPGIAAGILYLAVFATVVAYYLQTRSQRRLTPTRAGILFALEPVFAGVLSVGLGQDAVTPRLVVGAALVVGGILVSSEK